jgi:hypothetical protein
VQCGAYGEHQLLDVEANGNKFSIEQSFVHIRLAPGAGAKLTIGVNRYANVPTMWAPWDR